jgi:hypothetical protein
MFNKKNNESALPNATVATSKPEETTVDQEPIDEGGPHDKFESSADLCEQARAGRNISDIPMHDGYWDVVNRHRATHGTHAVRVDELPEAKKTKELEAKGVVVDK